MFNFKKSPKKIVSVLVALISVLTLSGSIYASAASEAPTVNGSNQFNFTDSKSVAYDDQIPTVNYNNDINGYNKFVFATSGISTQSTEEPTSLWDWSNGKYSISGSSNKATLYTNYYFKNVTGRTFNLSAGSSNRITVDLVHKGLIFQTVVSTWTIDAGKSKKVTIKSSDLGDYKDSDKYYFRFNSNPIGKSYSVSGTFE
ncbi:hypothetical protein [Paenibacillus apiarius]|uniref:Uncharacterized protein n=1 Tax=Paenibacillus apiarius TaxID=46240 RepID=A0ABT4E4M0_9BACL|nr:hypothetical protein [Paenibacillus apiarius]MCY9517756.1 hypothetical protein [Paenibacillus apiarius]MCY9523458.1 hypothetical protein [Paenibacillus apiarius]MCY9554956.1 hypothetical protein [Paenibacillus apiarius]MCY9561550.1 hypothetical protein [Paenibacillus apiarius]MCY9682224.1 hypothetical protein [Paenibacillus apiarius]